MRTITVLAGLVLTASAAPALATETHCVGNERNLATVQEMTEVLFNQRDESQASRFYAPQVVSHNADAGGAGATVPISTMQKMWVNSKITYPDRKLVNDLIVCAADIVVVRVSMTGTMKGPLGDIPPTGKAFSTSAIDIYRLKDGKVVERWGNNDQITIMRQLGLMETLVAAEKK